MEVVISHFPPEAVSGTWTVPVDVLAANIFSERSVPFISPVEVFREICLASQFSKWISPVLLLMVNLSEEIVFFMVILPVLPVEMKF